MCSGYASLMRTLCISIGIPCMDLEGHAHEYNAVYDSENAKWIFVDATWCSSNSYTVDKEWEYHGYSYRCFDLTPEEIAEFRATKNSPGPKSGGIFNRGYNHPSGG